MMGSEEIQPPDAKIHQKRLETNDLSQGTTVIELMQGCPMSHMSHGIAVSVFSYNSHRAGSKYILHSMGWN